MEHSFVTMDVFAEHRFGGNQLAIFPDTDDLDTETMQAIACELNLSETIFITRPKASRNHHVRIFTPKVELPFAGHPLVGAAIYLSMQENTGEIAMEVRAGTVRATVGRKNGRPEAAIAVPQLPEPGPASQLADAAAVLSLPAAEIAFPPAAYSAGVPYTFVPLKSRDALTRSVLDHGVWRAKFRASWAPAIFALTMEDWTSGKDIHGRMFAPGIGISEDPATGSAAAAMAGLLVQLQGPPADGTCKWTLYQGEDMGRPSQIAIETELRNGLINAARIRGTAVEVVRGTMQI